VNCPRCGAKLERCPCCGELVHVQECVPVYPPIPIYPYPPMPTIPPYTPWIPPWTITCGPPVNTAIYAEENS
jgi:hypothetical protein